MRDTTARDELCRIIINEIGDILSPGDEERQANKLLDKILDSLMDACPWDRPATQTWWRSGLSLIAIGCEPSRT